MEDTFFKSLVSRDGDVVRVVSGIVSAEAGFGESLDNSFHGGH